MTGLYIPSISTQSPSSTKNLTPTEEAASAVLFLHTEWDSSLMKLSDAKSS